MTVLRILLCVFVFAITACDKVELKPTQPQTSEEISDNDAFSGDFIKDSKGGLFISSKWYHYSLENHIIWPLYDVYAIKTPHGVYKLQIISYYDLITSEAGVYTLKIDGGGQNREFILPAPGCGNPYTNPNHAACLTDPAQNAFVYLDLETLTTTTFTDTEALTQADWDIAFKGTDVRLNAGTSGPSSVVGALLGRFDGFLKNNQIDPMALQNPQLQQEAKNLFSTLSAQNVTHYFLPDGIDRVIHERDWYIEELGLRRPQTNKFWRVQAWDGETVYRVSFPELSDAVLADGYSTRLTVEFGLESVPAVTQTVQLDLSTVHKALSLCISFTDASVVKCSSDNKQWEIKLVGQNQLKDGQWNRDWRFFTSNGAQGPLQD